MSIGSALNRLLRPGLALWSNLVAHYHRGLRPGLALWSNSVAHYHRELRTSILTTLERLRPSVPAATSSEPTPTIAAGTPMLNTNWRATIFAGFVVAGVGFGGMDVWGALARLDGAVMGDGVVTSESYKKTLQHLEGGIVREILVRDGSVVKAGDVLLRLDPTKAEATSGVYRGQLAALQVAESSFVAERDEVDELEFPQDVLRMREDPLVAKAIVDQLKHFAAGRETVRRQRDVSLAQIAQIQDEIRGYQIQEQTAVEQLVFVENELTGLRQLWGKQLVNLSKLSEREQDLLRLKGVIANAKVSAAKAAQKISETQLQLEQVRQQRREDAAKALPDLRKQINDVRQQIVMSSDTLNRVEVRSPIDGTVQQLRIFTIGGVLKPGDSILDIVPLSDELIVQARISPTDVDALRPGMAAEVRFPAFHRAFVPFMMGTVRTVSRDRIVDTQSPNKDVYFSAEIKVDRSSIPDDIAEKLISGLSASVIVPTGERTPLEYMLSPLFDRMRSAMRER